MRLYVFWYRYGAVERSDLHLQSSIELERNKNHSIPRKDTLLELSLSF